MTLKLKVKKLHEDAVIPKYQTAGAIAFDLHSIEDGVVEKDQPKAFKTGLAFEIPEGFGMFVYSRSGHGFKDDIRLGNGTGVIDFDYRGEVQVKLTKDIQSDKPFIVKKGERIAQAVIKKIEQVDFVEVEDLSSTERGEGGFGSTNK